MKKTTYRITKEETSNGRLYVLHEGVSRKNARQYKGEEKRRWQVVCCAYDKELLRGVKEDILRELREKTD